MLENFLGSIKRKYENIKNENNMLDSLLQTTTTFNNLFPILNKNKQISEHKISFILENCPDLNEDKARLISSIIPIQETFLDVIYAIEVISNKEYFLVPTNCYLWVISPTNYGAYLYKDLKCQIVKNNLMSKIILLNNILLEASGGNKKIDMFLGVINDSKKREVIIQEKIKYLQGILPVYQNLNRIGSGISLDSDENIVLHKRDDNLRVKKEELLNYEILLDNQVYLSKNSTSSNVITNFQTSCYQISIRITTTSKSFIIPILEMNAFSNKYNSHDSIFQTNLNFAVGIIKKLDELTKINY